MIDGTVLSLIEVGALETRASGMKNQFLTTLSHELHTPLPSLLVQAQLVGRKNVNAARIRHAVEAMELAAKTQLQLLDEPAVAGAKN
jgi:two-component system CheB/CheR fusion protein